MRRTEEYLLTTYQMVAKEDVYCSERHLKKTEDSIWGKNMALSDIFRKSLGRTF